MCVVVDQESDSEMRRACHSCVSPGGGKSSGADTAAWQPPKRTSPESKGKGKSSTGASGGLKLSAADPGKCGGAKKRARDRSVCFRWV